MKSTKIHDLQNKYYKAEQEFSNAMVEEITAHVTKHGQADKDGDDEPITSLNVRIPRQDGHGVFRRLFVRAGSLYCQYEDDEAVYHAELLLPRDLHFIYTTL